MGPKNPRAPIQITSERIMNRTTTFMFKRKYSRKWENFCIKTDGLYQVIHCSHNESIDTAHFFAYSSTDMILDWSKLPHPIIALSPMADMTDSAFCRTVKHVMNKSGADAETRIANFVMFREMVSAEAVVRGNNKTLDMTEIHPDERPLVQQLFGSDPDV